MLRIQLAGNTESYSLLKQSHVRWLVTHCTKPLHPAERMYKPDAGQQYSHQLQHVWTTIVRKKKLNNRNVQEYHTDEINTYLSSCHYGSKCEGLKCSNGVGYEELTNQTTWNNIECNSHNKRISYLWYSNAKQHSFSLWVWERKIQKIDTILLIYFSTALKISRCLSINLFHLHSPC